MSQMDRRTHVALGPETVSNVGLPLARSGVARTEGLTNRVRLQIFQATSQARMEPSTRLHSEV